MQKTLKALTPLSLTARFLAAGFLGVLILWQPAFVRRFLNALCVAALLASGVPALASALRERGARRRSLVPGLAGVLGAVVLMIFPSFLRGSIALAVGVWSLLVGAVQLGFAVQLFFTHEKGKLKFCVLGALSLLAGAAMLANLEGGDAIRWLAGLFLILYALWQLADLVGLLVNRNVESSPLLSRLRVKPPVLLTALMPSLVFNRLAARHAGLRQDLVLPKPAGGPVEAQEALEVLFHLGKNVAYGFGHVDVSLRGQTFSYGCYDEQSNRVLGLLSDGVILVCDTEPYLRFCQQTEKKLMIGFTLGLSSIAADRVETAMREMLSMECEPWRPAKRPEYTLGGRFFKVRQGAFSVYNALRTNCAAMAEIIASHSGLNLLPPNGLVTPGGYLSYLQEELRDPESNVLRQTIYGPRAPKKGEPPT